MKKYFISNDNAITIQLVKLAVPVIGSTFMSLAYNLINMIWVGKLGSGAVAAVGTAGFFLHLGWAVSCIVTTGAGIKISHSVGMQDSLLTKSYVKSGMAAITILSIIYFVILVTGKNILIAFFNLNNHAIENSAVNYLGLSSIVVFFSFRNFYYTSIFTGYGDTRTPFRINLIGLITNTLLDPIFIFTAGLGINGSAFATIISQMLVTFLYVHMIRKTSGLMPGNVRFSKTLLNEIIKLSVSPALQRIIFIVIAIVMARIISGWGAAAIAVQKVGVQIEAISFMTAGGFSNALSTLSGQAFGAKNYKKQWDGFISASVISIVIGITASLIFIIFPDALFSIFINDPESVSMGKDYLIILGYSQIFACIESAATGAFYGWGRTNVPALTSISLTAFRIPLALFFIKVMKTNLNGVWWSISLSSIGKGIILFVLFTYMLKSFLKKQLIRADYE